MKFTKSIALLSLFAFPGLAWAQAPAAPAAPAMTAPAAPAVTAPAAPAMTKPAMTKPAAPKVKKPRSAKSIECSKQADSQTLHGKPRQEFMSKCKKG